MSSVGAAGVGGVGGGGSVGGAGGGAAGAGAARTQAVTPSKGAGGVSDYGGKDSLAVGDNNVVGNTQTQIVNITNNNFNMNTNDFCSLHNSSGVQESGGMQEIGQMSIEDMQKMLMMMLIMKMLEAIMEGSGVGQQGALGASMG